jgi:hypothetical protein
MRLFRFCALRISMYSPSRSFIFILFLISILFFYVACGSVLSVSMSCPSRSFMLPRPLICILQWLSCCRMRIVWPLGPSNRPLLVPPRMSPYFFDFIYLFTLFFAPRYRPLLVPPPRSHCIGCTSGSNRWGYFVAPTYIDTTQSTLTHSHGTIHTIKNHNR